MFVQGYCELTALLSELAVFGSGGSAQWNCDLTVKCSVLLTISSHISLFPNMRVYCSDCELIPVSRELEVTEVRFQVSDFVFSLSMLDLVEHMFHRWPFWLKLFSLRLK